MPTITASNLKSKHQSKLSLVAMLLSTVLWPCRRSLNSRICWILKFCNKLTLKILRKVKKRRRATLKKKMKTMTMEGKSQKRRRRMKMSFRKRALSVLKRGTNLPTPDGRTWLRHHRQTLSQPAIPPSSSSRLSNSSNPKTNLLSNLLRLRISLGAIWRTCW